MTTAYYRESTLILAAANDLCATSTPSVTCRLPAAAAAAVISGFR